MLNKKIENDKNEVICNKCKEKFIVRDIKEKKIGDLPSSYGETLVSYFSCTNCSEKFIVLCEDKKLRTMKNRHEEMKRELEKHMKSMFRYSDSLKEKVIEKL